MAKGKRAGSSQGPSIDRTGTPVVDPTANVIAILAAAVERQDDLRTMESAHVREMMDVRAEGEKVATDCAHEIATLRDRHALEMRKAEADRIDAIRSVDVAAVAQASQQASQVATTLASQVATSAETLRTQVQAAAQAATVALAAALEPIQKDIADLRRVQYEQQGQRAGVTEQRGDYRDRGVTSRGWMAIAFAFGSFMLAAAGIIIALAIKP